MNTCVHTSDKHVNYTVESRDGFWTKVANTFVMVSDLLATWHQRTGQRKALLSLDDRILSDIGISRAQVEQEANKPFWKE
ncbi:MAG: DUF1127 domain-containing protein [Rhodospirillales bacterium]|nr:DUF1127 domain-containing protein [Rhodospirillales bacterium]